MNYEKNILPCRKEELQCLLNCLRCHYRKDCGRDYVSIKITCSAIHLNRSRPISGFTNFPEASSGTSMPDSSVLVAGVVIGVVLFLSCMAIIISSLQKKGCFPQLQLNTDSSYTPDCFYAGSSREPRSVCTEELPPAFYFSSCVETRVSIMHPDSPPRYDECVGPGATQASVATDDPPPPYSLVDPCQRNVLALSYPGEEDASRGTATGSTPEPSIPSISLLMSFPTEAAPPYETVVNEQNSQIPLVPLDSPKDSTDCDQTLLNRIM
uniref:Uncharacterized protein n=1 Tax=Salvator merianae TaxID=96440 RepID=A0A8D0DM68_SALMN